MGSDTRDIDNAALASVFHSGAKLLTGQQSSSGQVQIKTGAPVVRWNLLKGEVAGHGAFRIVPTGRIHQDCGCSPLLDDFLFSASQRISIQCVGEKKISGAALFSDGCNSSLTALRVPPEDSDAGASAGQRL